METARIYNIINPLTINHSSCVFYSKYYIPPTSTSLNTQIWAWQQRGDEVLVLSRDKECTNKLLEAYGILYTSISTLRPGKAALIAEMLERDWKMWQAARRFKPDLLVGIMGVTIVQVCKLIRKPAVVFYDTENASITNRFVYPLAHSVCIPTCYQGTVNGNHVTYPGYHELVYLHPNPFYA